MVLVDSSVWIDHLRRPDRALVDLLRDELALAHPFVVGEVAMGSIAARSAVLASLLELLPADIATHGEVMALVDAHRLFGLGLGYVDAHLLASAMIMPGATLWTRDKRLRAAAERLGVAANPSG